MGKTQKRLEKAEMVNLCHVRSNQSGFHSFMLQELMGVTLVKEREKLPASLQSAESGSFHRGGMTWVALQRHDGKGTDSLFITREIVFFLSCDRFSLACGLSG